MHQSTSSDYIPLNESSWRKLFAISRKGTKSFASILRHIALVYVLLNEQRVMYIQFIFTNTPRWKLGLRKRGLKWLEIMQKKYEYILSTPSGIRVVPGGVAVDSSGFPGSGRESVPFGIRARMWFHSMKRKRVF